MKRSGLVALTVVAAIAVLLFAPVTSAGFLYDDHELVTRNPRIGQVSLLADAFLKPFWEVISPLRSAAGFYRPLGAWLLAGCYHLFGDWAGGYHLVSLLLHAACVLLVTRLALTLGLSLGAAAAAGLLFAVHGAHVEAVAWISAAPDLLATAFALLGLTSVVRHRYLAGAAWLLAGMLSKEAAIGAWLLAIAWVLFWPVAGNPRARRLAPLLAAGALLYALRAQAFDSLAAGFDRRNTWHYFAPLEEVVLSLSLLGRYLLFLLWPWPHAPFSPLRVDLAWNSAERLIPAVLGATAALAGLFTWLRSVGRSAISFVALGLLFAALAPVLNTRALGQYPFEERFLYLPSAGFAILTGASLAWLARLTAMPRLLPACAALLIVPHAATVLPATRPWLDEEAFFNWARTASPNAMTPHLGHGRLMLERAQLSLEPRERENWADQAFGSYQRSLTVDVDVWFVSAIEREMGNLGLADSLFIGGDIRAAQETYQQIVGHYRNSAIGFVGLGNCAGALAEAAAATQHESEFNRLWNEALGHYQRALALDPGLIAARNGHAKALASLRRFGEALPWAEECFATDPGNLDYATSLAAVYFELQRFTFAQRTLQRFIEAAPEHPARPMVEQELVELARLRASGLPGSPP
jgi:tetratricopeptide (TPR) repeat protein